MHTLKTYGWNSERATDWQQHPSDGLIPARIVVDYGRQYKIATPNIHSAQISGTLSHKLKTVEMPKIGDWVAVQLHSDGSHTIQAVLPRTTEIVRGQVGRLADKQVVAANVDMAFVVQPLDHDFSIERLQRYIFQLSSQGIMTVILLNKADTSSDAAAKQALLGSLGVESLIISASKDSDMSAVERLITPGQTIVIMGSSGAGKSTLTNRLLGENRQTTAPIRQRDSKGRHTTVHRKLFVLPGGGMIIDTPGVRELQLWGNVADLDKSFPEIAAVSRQCRYTNCAHGGEDHCAVQGALADGSIDYKRYKTYANFRRELDTLETRRKFIDKRRSEQAKKSANRRRRIATESHDDFW